MKLSIQAARYAFALSCLVAVIMLSSPALCADTAAAQKSTPTIDNLMAAYNGESNASARYQAFGKKAETEGYLKVASLFKATSKSEEIHARNHAEVIKKMGYEPKATLEQVKVGSTRENLEAALKGETYEKDTMYPQFIDKAKSDNNKAAVRTFKFAQGVEENHAKLYASALQNLDAWKVGGVVFSVCNVCGNTVEKVDFVLCPVCHEPRSKYFAVN